MEMFPKSRQLHILRLLIPHWKFLLLGLIASMLTGLTELLHPWPLKIVIDSVIGSKPMPEWFSVFTPLVGISTPFAILNVMALLLLVAAIIGAVSSYAQTLLMSAVGQWVTHDLRTTLYHHIQRLSLSYHDQSQTGDLISRVTDDIDTVQDFITSTLLDTLVDILTLAGMISIMLYIDWKFTFVALLIAPPLFFFIHANSHRIKRASRAVRKKESEIICKVQEVFSSIRVIKAFASEQYERRRFEQQSLESMELALRAKALKAGVSPVVDIIVAAGSASVLWYGGWLVLDGTLTAGGLIVFLMYLGKLYSPVRRLARLPDSFAKPAIAFERIEEVMGIEVGATPSGSMLSAPPLRGMIEFEQVSFEYRKHVPILEDVSFDILPGQVAAFVGPTGAGKSTIINLLARFYEPTAGAIRLDGVDAASFRLRSLRKQLAFVLQETILFRAPISQNIAYGRPSASQDEIIEAAKAANAHEFIRAMPEGYDTLVGERGVTLSGGQRQRIGIARAIIRNAPILILDEPTAGLDVESEAMVLDALGRLMRGRTCIVITHRLTTIRDADVIFVLKEGRIVERGGHETLMRLQGCYYDLYKKHHHDASVFANAGERLRP